MQPKQRTDWRMRAALDSAAQRALQYLEALDDAPVSTGIASSVLRGRLKRPLADAGVDPEQVISELVWDVDGGLAGSTGGRFFAWVHGGALPAALAADWLTSAWDQNAGIYASAPAATVVEEVAGAWLKEIFGLPAEASFAFVSGCQMAHVTCIAAARHSLLESRGWDVEQLGLSGSPRIRLLCGDQRHGTIERAVRLLGLGTGNLENLKTGADGGLTPAALEQALDRDTVSPTIVFLQAGDVNTGAFDAFDRLIPIARSRGAWVHVDGAFGLWAAASPRYRHLISGIAAADSWATDGHKWLNVPYDSAYAFVAHPHAHRAAMSYGTSYLAREGEAREPIDWNPEWSRRARGFSTYAAIRELGRSGIAALVERCCEHARAIVAGIERLPYTEVLSAPVINQALVRFLDPRGRDHDRHTDDAIAAIVNTGEAFFGGTTWRGQRAMRISVCNWRTSERDVHRTVEAVGRALAELRAGS